MFSRYRSYTCYSEENNKLVPSVEPTVTLPKQQQPVQKEEPSKPEPEATQEKVEVK